MVGLIESLVSLITGGQDEIWVGECIVVQMDNGLLKIENVYCGTAPMTIELCHGDVERKLLTAIVKMMEYNAAHRKMMRKLANKLRGTHRSQKFKFNESTNSADGNNVRAVVASGAIQIIAKDSPIPVTVVELSDHDEAIREAMYAINCVLDGDISTLTPCPPGTVI